MYVFTQKVSSVLGPTVLEPTVSKPTVLEPTLTLALTADERSRSRYRYRVSSGITDSGCRITASDVSDRNFNQPIEIYLELPRGTALRDGDCLTGDGHTEVLRIVAKPEPVITVRVSPQMSTHAQPAVQLLQAAYHLGNRHVALEVGPDYLRLAPDPVLEAMLHQLGVTVTAETIPFQPESGAYGHHH